MNPGVLARVLFEIAPPMDGLDVELPVLLAEGEWQPLPLEKPVLTPIRADAAAIVKELAAALKDADWRPDQSSAANRLSGPWTFGEATQRAAIRRIHRGFLEPVRRFPILENVPALVVQFLTKLPGGRDYIKRENHPGVGWHYHYLADRHTRSDVILAWDTRWNPQPNLPPRSLGLLRPLFYEKHGEGHTNFHGKPWLWGETKRVSMYDVCTPDLTTWPINEFRCASNKADPVWPTTAKLTPIKIVSTKRGSSERGERF